MYFCTRRGLVAVHAAPVSFGSSCVSGPPWVTYIASISPIWRRYRRPKFWNYFLIPNRQNEKTSRKKRKFGLIFIYDNCFSEHLKFFKESFAELFYDLKWSNCMFTSKLVAQSLTKNLKKKKNVLCIMENIVSLFICPHSTSILNKIRKRIIITLCGWCKSKKSKKLILIVKNKISCWKKRNSRYLLKARSRQMLWCFIGWDILCRVLSL